METIVIELQTPPGTELEITEIIRKSAPNPEGIDIKTSNVVQLSESLHDYIPPTLAVAMQIVSWAVDSKTAWDGIKAQIDKCYSGRKRPLLPSKVKIRLGEKVQELDIRSSDSELILKTIREFNEMRKSDN